MKATTIFINEEEEKILLGHWLIGKYLEDMDLFDANLFQYKEVFKGIKRGSEAIQIAKESHIPIAELMAMTTNLQELFYKQIVHRQLNITMSLKITELQNKIYDDNSIKEIKALCQRYEEGKMYIKPEANLSDRYVQELRERKIQDRVEWKYLPSLIKKTNGIRRKELTIISARPSTGKSAFAIQLATDIAHQGKKVLYFSLEMSTEEILDRMLMREREADGRQLKHGNVTGKELDEYKRYIKKVEEDGLLKIYHDRNYQAIKEAVLHEKPFAIVIDQLSNITSNREFASIRERFTYLTSNLKAMAMEQNVSVFLLCQINREVHGQNKPTLANLKESGSIEEDADNVIMMSNCEPKDINNPEEIDWKTTRVVRFNLAKARNGEVGEFYTRYIPSRMWFYEN